MTARDKWNRAFDELDEDDRRFWLAVLEDEVRRARSLRRASLTLVTCSHLATNPSNNRVNPSPASGIS
jgi:gluconate kinase